MTDELRPPFRQSADRMAEQFGPILGAQYAHLGAERAARFTQGHASLQAMAMFLTISVHTVPFTGYSDAALAALETDADDVIKAATEWAESCKQLAEMWRAQRQERSP